MMLHWGKQDVKHKEVRQRCLTSLAYHQWIDSVKVNKTKVGLTETESR